MAVVYFSCGQKADARIQCCCAMVPVVLVQLCEYTSDPDGSNASAIAFYDICGEFGKRCLSSASYGCCSDVSITSTSVHRLRHTGKDWRVKPSAQKHELILFKVFARFNVQCARCGAVAIHSGALFSATSAILVLSSSSERDN